MPNFLVIKQLDTLYLGENYVRVVCKRVWRNLKKSLMTGSCDWRVAKGGTRVKHAGELKGHVSCSTTGQNFQSDQAVSSRLKLATRSSCELELPERSVWLKLSLHIPHTPYYKYPYTHKMLRASRENFLRETLEKNKIDSFIIFSLWFSKFLYSHPFHWHIIERYISQILISPYLYQWEGFWYLGSSSEGTNSFWLMQWAIAGFGKLEKTRFGVTLLEQEAWRA